MKTPHYDYHDLLMLIDQKHGDIVTFTNLLQVDTVKFLEFIGDGEKLPTDIIEKASKLLDIPPDEIGFYFYQPEPEHKTRERGRPVKAITKTSTPPKNDTYYTVTEACQLLGIHRRTLQARLRDGTIKGKLIGREWRIYKNEIFEGSN